MTIRSELYSVFDYFLKARGLGQSSTGSFQTNLSVDFRNFPVELWTRSRIQTLDINRTNVENHNWAKNGKLFHFQLYISIQLYYYKKSKFLDQLEQKQKVHNDSIVLFSLALHLTIQLYQDLPLKMGRKHKIVPVRIPTVKLKIPGKSMGKAGYQTSVTFKL